MVPGRWAHTEPDDKIRNKTGKHQIKRGIREFGLLKYLKKEAGFNNFA
jgi:hypothetical protein